MRLKLTDQDWKVVESHSQRPRRPVVKGGSLTQKLGENPSGLDGLKLSLVGKGVTHIDDLAHSRFFALNITSITTLYMSNNSIENIAGIQQFTALRSLSLANNLIRYVHSLLPLQGLEQLETLSLEGNPVCAMAYYRDKVIHYCRVLRSLDGCIITPEERGTVAVVVRKAASLEQQLESNTCRILVLEHIASLLSCHGELLQNLAGQFR